MNYPLMIMMILGDSSIQFAFSLCQPIPGRAGTKDASDPPSKRGDHDSAQKSVTTALQLYITPVLSSSFPPSYRTHACSATRHALNMSFFGRIPFRGSAPLLWSAQHPSFTPSQESNHKISFPADRSLANQMAYPCASQESHAARGQT